MSSALIGRDHPAGVLRAAIDRAAVSHGGLVLVAGEAGIGKTALVTGAVAAAREQGALVLSGSCWDGAPGYWPWTQVVRGLKRGAGDGAWEEARQAGGGVLAALLGADGGIPADGADGLPAGGSDGFPLYDAVTSALAAVAARRPVVVVLDDLHWADPASLRLLAFAAQHTWFERLLLVGTYRDVETDAAGHPLRELIAAVTAKAANVTLTGLDVDGTGRLMARTAGREPAPELVAEVHRRTGGNPFFVEQTARLWAGGASVDAVAPGVRDALRRRLDLLPAPVAGLLGAAAVLGREFHRQVLAAVVGEPVARTDRLLETAVAARLVIAKGGGDFAFAHDLVRETLYDALPEPRARHAAVVRALDTAPALAGKVLPADRARHAWAAGAELDRERAMALLREAAQDALGRIADEEALIHLRRVRELAAAGTPRERVLAGLALGEQLIYAGESAEALPVLDEAVREARATGEHDLLGRAALTLFGAMGHPGSQPGRREELLREAHAALVGGHRDEASDPDRMAAEIAVALAVRARRGADDEALGFGLWSRHHAIWGPGTAAERVALTEELAAIARRVGDVEGEHFATALRWVALLELGDARFLESYRAYVAGARRGGLPRMEYTGAIDESIIEAFMGDFARAEELLDHVLAENGDTDHVTFTTGMLHHHRWALLMLQGRYAEAERALDADTRPDRPRVRLARALTAVRRGDPEPARRLLADDAPEAPAADRARRPLLWRLQAETAAATRDPRLAAQAREGLAALRGQWLVSLFGWDVGGPADHWLAMLDAAEERWDQAVEGFTAARRAADRLRSRPWSLEARAGLAAALAARGGPGDAERAAGLRAEVAREAGELGMRHLAAPVEEEVRAPAAEREFRYDGRVWTLTYAGRTVHLPDAKGLRDMHLLLARPGEEIPAVRLLSPEGGEEVVAARRLGGDPVLDEEAKAQYKRRLERLDEEIDRAAAVGDDARAAEYDKERDALLHELRAAAGLGGRSRRLGDEAERARKAVSGRIRDAIRKIESGHPALAAHLKAAISTGSTCAYRPGDGERAAVWRL
ncbi:AAA family ATPase [Streptomyces sp. A7024]|uniref:AAA family ATPase n=1 Tax=Streptomyces coryli TaxID=1128680 RepID=A0A6G4U344_9ACTN|nr:AAA family ATPase [Streptomyces coryli]NGN65651.1 AAA family ATPase [Streptomyces coryli]